MSTLPLRRCAAPFLSLILCVLPGCFTWVAADPVLVPVEVEGRVLLTRQGAADLPDEFPAGTQSLSGRLMGTRGDSLVIQVPVATRQAGFHAASLRQELLLHLSQVVGVERKEVSWRRTALAVLGGAAAIGAIIALIIQPVDGEEGRPPGEGPEQLPPPPWGGVLQ
jgi:hypothetical protein